MKLSALRWAVGGAALDLGCGLGWYASTLADRGFRVTGIDQSDQVKDPRVRVRVAEIRAPLPFDRAVFSTVLMFDILEHVPDETSLMSEVARVCAPGGRVIVSVPNGDDGFLPLYGLTYLHRIDRSHVREYVLDELPGRLEAFGFRTLYCALEGRSHLPLVFSEFVRGSGAVKALVRNGLRAMQKVGLIHNPAVAGDIHWVGERVAG